MKTILTLATTFALSVLGHSQNDNQHPDKAQAILAVEQHIGGRFLAEAQSNNGRSVRWPFSEPLYHDIIPVTVDVTAYPTRAEAEAVST
jgi:hypothetical protein